MELDVAAVELEFAKFSGETAQEDGTQRKLFARPFALNVPVRVQGQLKPGLTQEEFALYQQDLAALAAAEALYQLLLTEEASSPQSLTAGDVKVTSGEGSGKAALLAAEKRRAVGQVLQEPGFYFGRIGREDPHDTAE